MDLKQFWEDDEKAHAGNCFSTDAPQVALGIRMSDECVFAELGEEGEPWGHTPYERRMDLNKRYNDKAEEIVGMRLLREDYMPEDLQPDKARRIGEVFGGRYIWRGGTEWLESDIKTPRALEAQLDRIDNMDLREFILPEDRKGYIPRPRHSVRGPVTLACSIFGVENLIFLILEETALAKRFSDTIADVIIKMTEILDEETGEAGFGFEFFDDLCCMLNPDMYGFFGYPVLKRVFERFCPRPEHYRYQHSDSAMEHLLPILGTLDFHAVNFGPTVTVDKIRKHMPNTRIDGCLAPYTFMNNDRDKIIAEVRRDCQMAKQHGRGVNLSTAGSINNGSLLESMRTVMWAISEYGRY